MRVPTVPRFAPIKPPSARADDGITAPTGPDGRESVVAAVRTALPEHRYDQSELTELIGDLCLAPGADRALLRRLHGASGVRTRHLALPLDRYAAIRDFGEANAAWMTAGLELGERALTSALGAAGVSPSDVDLLVCTSITGIAAPSLDARLASRMGMRPDVKRIPVFGLGCVAGAAGLARLHDYLRGHRDDVAVLLSVELCSLTLQQRDDSAANLVAGALFGDGAAAVVAHAARADDRRPGRPTVVATRSLLYPGTEHLLGWAIGAGGFRPVVDAGIPDVVTARIGPDLRAFLSTRGLAPDDIGVWLCHPGGPRILTAVAHTLDLPEEALLSARRALAASGNMSSASVLRILEDVTTGHPPPPGSWGLMMAMGPGFCVEFVLLRW
ncbi:MULTISPECIES: type III polyketide synthase [Streptomyces]|uniref:Chalcone synthase n=1 Tax=Streptomyces venezuelae (strain ATCC 10712 / CBS 650.69 / DSM 40230 / JCM 4526 / NBRC 13096 / PD 04745) TaxID=953739 RepID=F2RLZ7_STRVP|nr:3-oxoacyl-[acyl-carrier-protein] synthase III C-terminal domain-containing protein [Streptomyces venezuelae]QES03174.1 type III polyketide synthase [Streptomyces venezuelae ATCC 10712]CCA60527.1 Chalcone synthase [Streptomyces venezuelae ATCC 10712]